jgi:A/G-specific adenine glycosylase
VFIHSFCTNEGRTFDRDLLPLIEQALALPRNTRNPRDWYYALMDYGAYLKSTVPNPSRQSAHHIRQKPFKGSNRELRSKILKLIMKGPNKKRYIIKFLSIGSKKQIIKNLHDLETEGFIECDKGWYRIRE